LVERQPVGPDLQHLQVGAARVRRTTQHDGAAAGAGEERLECVSSQIRIHGDGIGAVPIEGLGRVALGRGSDVATLGVQNQDDVGMLAADVLAEDLQLPFGSESGEVGDLGLERAHRVRGGVDDAPAELEDAVGGAVDNVRELLDVGVEPHAQQRVGPIPGQPQLGVEAQGLSPRR